MRNKQRQQGARPQPKVSFGRRCHLRSSFFYSSSGSNFFYSRSGSNFLFNRRGQDSLVASRGYQIGAKLGCYRVSVQARRHNGAALQKARTGPRVVGVSVQGEDVACFDRGHVAPPVMLVELKSVGLGALEVEATRAYQDDLRIERQEVLEGHNL
eukprot:scaffold904_cov239-Pinguiococcus_pyrenoidosus.AAC.3